MNLIVYDFDKTIYGGETSMDFFFYYTKKYKINRIKYIIKAIYGLLVKKNLVNIKEDFFLFLKDKNNEELKKDIHEFWKLNKYKIYPWIEQELINNKKEADKLILISASPTFLLKEISEDLGFDLLLATDFEENKYFNPKIVGTNCKYKEKVNKLNENYSDYKIIAFYSDSISDLPLFELAERKYWIDKGVKKEGLPKK